MTEISARGSKDDEAKTKDQLMKDAMLEFGQRQQNIFKVDDIKNILKHNIGAKFANSKNLQAPSRIIRGAFTNEASVYDTGRINVGDTSETIKSKARNIYGKKKIGEDNMPVLNQNDVNVTEEDLQGEVKIKYVNPEDEVRERKENFKKKMRAGLTKILKEKKEMMKIEEGKNLDNLASNSKE